MAKPIEPVFLQLSNSGRSRIAVCTEQALRQATADCLKVLNSSTSVHKHFHQSLISVKTLLNFRAAKQQIKAKQTSQCIIHCKHEGGAWRGRGHLRSWVRFTTTVSIVTDYVIRIKGVKDLMVSGCGSVGRAVASDTRGP